MSEAIPITATAWVSQAQPILRRAPRRKTVAPTGRRSGFIRDWIYRPRRTLRTPTHGISPYPP
ncbi:hypothetical protein PCLA_02r0539 [Pseudomonas citronellolis]|nr:hypothetical protein PCLA_02r0539 [Pseudomonas citronellolis]